MDHQQYMDIINALRNERETWLNAMVELTSLCNIEERSMTEEEFVKFEEAHEMASGISNQIQTLFAWHVDELRKIA